MNPEILALIFVRIPADDMVRIVPLVCKSWMEAVAGPYCWHHIDIAEWCRRRNESSAIDLAVRKLVRRSRSTFQRLSAYRLGDSGFVFVSNRERCLTELQIPMSEITDHMVLKHVKSLPNLKILDISHCSKITFKGLEAFGTECKSLAFLKRNMPPQRYWGNLADSIPHQIDDSEAKAIANTMPNLQHPELCYGRFGDVGLLEIVTKCDSLTHLDIQGSLNVELVRDLEEACENIHFFGRPCIDESSQDFSDSEEESL